MSGFWDLSELHNAAILNCKCDTLVAIAHSYLVTRADFECIGLGDELQALDNIEGGCELPNNWNSDHTKYALRYSFGGFVYVFIATVAHGSQQMRFELQTANPPTDSTSHVFEFPFDRVIQIRGKLNEIFADRAWTVLISKLAVAISVVKGAHPSSSPVYGSDPSSPSGSSQISN